MYKIEFYDVKGSLLCIHEISSNGWALSLSELERYCLNTAKHHSDVSNWRVYYQYEDELLLQGFDS